MENFWAGRTCLVTGGAGFGGSHLCEHLLNLGADVHVLDRWLPRNSYLMLSEQISKVNYIQGDIRDMDLLRLTLERFEINTIFHLAAQPIVPISNVLPQETFSINAQGTYTVLEAMRTAKSVDRMVFASSGAYYGATFTNQAIQESHPPLPATNIYAPSKVAGDVAVRTYAHVYGLKTAACRFMNTYGPGDTNFSRIIPRAIKNMITDSSYDFGARDDGSSQIDCLYIGDMAQAYTSVAENLESVAGEAFNFGTGIPVAIRDLTSAASQVFDGQVRTPIFSGPTKKKPSIKYLDINHAQKILDWQPTTTITEGLEKTIKWYQENWNLL
ncbi:NAD-dependent epimerase/dehydratase family protein [Acidithiobacillus thiooxidans]|nr:NAD-dependent epimerase/dehydratase family protein [Acidithiobacillus thiooxidans]MDR7925534.1 NAD-dependent epimerase/dehydratase family protein [Acidithiobacillus thiooxidans]